MNISNEELSMLELRVLSLALSRDCRKNVGDLVYKIPLLKVLERRRTGIGFITMFSMDVSDDQKVADSRVRVRPPPEVIGFHPGLHGVINFLVWIEGGDINSLEAASSSFWPDNEEEIVIVELPIS